MNELRMSHRHHWHICKRQNRAMSGAEWLVRNGMGRLNRLSGLIVWSGVLWYRPDNSGTVAHSKWMLNVIQIRYYARRRSHRTGQI